MRGCPKIKWHRAEIEFWAKLRILGHPPLPPRLPDEWSKQLMTADRRELDFGRGAWANSNWQLAMATGNSNFINLLTPTQRQQAASQPAQSRNELKAQQDNKEWQWLGYESWSSDGGVCVTHAHVSPGPIPKPYQLTHPPDHTITYPLRGSPDRRKLNLLPLAESREIRGLSRNRSVCCLSSLRHKNRINYNWRRAGLLNWTQVAIVVARLRVCLGNFSLGAIYLSELWIMLSGAKWQSRLRLGRSVVLNS